MLVENNSYPEDIRIFHEATALTEAGYLVSVICPSRPNRPWNEVSAGIHVFRYHESNVGKGFIGYLWEYSYSLLAMFLLSIIAFLKPGFDYIHAANPPDTVVLIAAFYKLLGRKFIFDQHDLSPEVFRLKFGTKSKLFNLVYKILIALERLSCILADHIIATNQSYKALEMERDRVPSDRITVVRNGPDPIEKIPFRLIEDIRQPGKKTILFLGVIGFQDGVDYLLRSLHDLKYRQGRDDFLCVIAGDGGALPGLKLLANELDLNGCVRFPGWIQEANAASYIHSADICIAPEPSNFLNDRSTMVKVMEYMAFGKPIVAFDLPEHRVTAQSAAIYAEPNNERDFAQKIAALMDDPEKCRTMAQIARQRIEKELSWPHQKAHLLEAYNKIDQNGGAEVQ
jgi:glycosyltransferase involved in cell wall biosynthesis